MLKLVIEKKAMVKDEGSRDHGEAAGTADGRSEGPGAGQRRLSCSVTLERKGTLFWEDHFSGAATKKKGKRGPLNN